MATVDRSSDRNWVKTFHSLEALQIKIMLSPSRFLFAMPILRAFDMVRSQ
ncbi:MAG: hypothetical protein IM596_07890 [Pseudanabaena sp. M051S1SP2A07QC]|nr:hypothetical protein [Pseudanabaena sp. M109S1SP2A07QC]MCA6521763.1 hypothetical protein [Pseudanabaena sp. M051S1SP2A07QC]